MCGPGFVGRPADASDLAGVAAVAAETGAALPDAQGYLAGGRLLVAVSAGDVIGFVAVGEPDEGGVAGLVGPAVGAAGFGLGVEKALLRRAADEAAARGVRALRAAVPAGDPVRAQALIDQGFHRTPEADAPGRSAFTRTL
ncbi:MAG TPA: GNAT family N-acetyltransferase [Thermodesulfobacteriota bacterium]